MRLKKNKNNKTERIALRLTEQENNKVKQKANIYTNGNVSEYMLYASLNFVPSKEDFEDEKAPPKRRGSKRKA